MAMLEAAPEQTAAAPEVRPTTTRVMNEGAKNCIFEMGISFVWQVYGVPLGSTTGKEGTKRA